MKTAQEEQKHSNSSSGGGSGGGGGGGGARGCSSRSQKKMKQKKVPQRGLGVAQLEKIRMEEQHKKGVHVVSSNHQITISPSSNNNSSSCFLRPTSVMSSSSNSAPVLHQSPIDLPSVPNLDFLNSNPLSLPKQFNGFGFRQPNSGMNLPFLPLPNELQRSQQPCSSSMMNVSSSSSILNFQMEPPSNQNLCASSYAPLWPDEEKMVGMKRPYPFAVETPPAPSFHFKFSPCCVGSSSVPRLDEPASCSNSCTLNNDPPAFSAIREGHSRSSTISATNHKVPNHTENGMLNGDFLTLAPPASPHLSSKFSSTDSVPEFGFQATPFTSEDDKFPVGQEPAFFSFFPAAKKEIGPVTNSTYVRHGEVAEKVDLSLKL